MSDLYPTKTRLALLAEIANGQVISNPIPEDPDDDEIVLFPNAPTEWQTRRRVTGRVRELEHAGWVQQYEHFVEWHLTVAGCAVLEEETRDG